MNCACDHHSSAEKNTILPWLPKQAPIVAERNKKTVPNLIPIGFQTETSTPNASNSHASIPNANDSHASIQNANGSDASIPNASDSNASAPHARTPRTAFSGLNVELLESQINLNAKLMEENNALKEEKDKVLAVKEKMAKEKELLAAKLASAAEQLQYLKKKMNKSNAKIQDELKENDDPSDVMDGAEQ